MLPSLRAVWRDSPAEALAHVMIAYEPVRAIGTGRTATAQEANRVCGEIRRLLGRAVRQGSSRRGAHSVRRLDE